ncbi:MAG: SRPBCC domain-containing protein [Proteobacteria bacterium]|nr:SRPBCC domain-containing protein [Pseudomonadota bacterium]
MLIHMEFLDRDEGTDMVFTQTRFSTDESRDQHEGGWTGSFASLADVLNDLIQEN